MNLRRLAGTIYILVFLGVGCSESTKTNKNEHPDTGTDTESIGSRPNGTDSSEDNHTDELNTLEDAYPTETGDTETAEYSGGTTDPTDSVTGADTINNTEDTGVDSQSSTNIDNSDDSEFSTESDISSDSDSLTSSDTVDLEGLDWIVIEGGSFEMGSAVEKSLTKPIFATEQPVHTVTLSTFEMMKNETIVGQYRACVDAEVCTEPVVLVESEASDCTSELLTHNWINSNREQHPVNCVSKTQAERFCIFIGGRLPSEAEWEYAARNRGERVLFPWGDEDWTCDRAVLGDGVNEGCGLGTTWPVCSKPNGHTREGLCDMIGNVYEFVADVFHFDYVGAPSNGSAWLDTERTPAGLVRGGSFSFDFIETTETTTRRLASKTNDIPSTDAVSTIYGFRCAR